MAESTAHLVDQVIPRVPVRLWVLSFPNPLRILFAAPPELLTPVLRIIHRVIAGFLLKQAGLRRATADTGAVTLIQSLVLPPTKPVRRCARFQPACRGAL